MDAAGFGEVVVVSVPFGRYGELPAEGFAGKVVIDTNNYYPQRDGYFEELDRDRTTRASSCRPICRAPVWSRRSTPSSGRTFATRAVPPVIPSASASRSPATTRKAKRIVAELIDEVGFDAIDAGTLAAGGRKHQPGSPRVHDGCAL